MKFRFLMVISALMFLSFADCGAKFKIPGKPISIKVSTVCKRSNTLAALIEDQQYEKLYREIFSDSLKQLKPFREFQSQLVSFREDYGEISLSYSGLQSCEQVSSNQYLVKYVLQYQERTVFTEFIFGEQTEDEDPPVKLIGYRFIDE